MYLLFLSRVEHSSPHGVYDGQVANSGVPPSEEVLHAQACSQAKRHKAAVVGPGPAAAHDGDNDDIATWKRYAHVLEYIAEKEFVHRAFGLFQAKLRENDAFMEHARATFSPPKTSPRAHASRFARHVYNISHAWFQDSKQASADAAVSARIEEMKEKCFDKTMRLFVLESGLTGHGN